MTTALEFRLGRVALLGVAFCSAFGAGPTPIAAAADADDEEESPGIETGSSAPSGPRGNPFACLGAGESVAKGLGVEEMRREIARRLANPPREEEGTFEIAVAHCTTAELMRRVGDTRAAEEYERAIAADPSEPGWELWYAYYLRNVRGARYPLFEQAERHYAAALRKLDALEREGRTRDFDVTTRDWVNRGLNVLYGDDGLPLVGNKAFPYASDTSDGIGVALTTMFRFSRDVNEFNVVDDARRFTSEASFASSFERLNRIITDDELRGIIRTPIRTDFYNRLRLRPFGLGAFDVSYRMFRAPESQIIRFTEPNNFGDVKVDEIAVGWKRSFDFYPLFDLTLDGGYRRVIRKGIVEWFPELTEHVNLYEARPVLSRFIGPDKLAVGMTYVFMDIPFIPGGLIEDRYRARSIMALWFDYAFYRPLLLPDMSTLQVRRQLTRGWHFYGGYVLDDEAYGTRTVHRRDAYFGTSLRGVGGFDFTLQGTYFTGETEYRRRMGPALVTFQDPLQTNAQARPTAVVLYRLIDEETMPGMPPNPLAMLNLVVPVRADFATEGWNAYENVRAGVELWSKLVFQGFRGTNFLLTAGYDVQWFHRLKHVVHMGHVDLRMGWNFL